MPEERSECGRNLQSQRGSQTASETLVKLKSVVIRAGAMFEPVSSFVTRIGCVNFVVRCSTSAGLSFHRKFVTGSVTLPFSMRKTPSRVSPVNCQVLGWTTRMYHRRVTSNPRSTDAIRSAILLSWPCPLALGYGLASAHCRQRFLDRWSLSIQNVPPPDLMKFRQH